jgi:hypothetical protein
LYIISYRSHQKEYSIGKNGGANLYTRNKYENSL